MVWNREELRGQHLQQLFLVVQATSSAPPRGVCFPPQASQHSRLHADSKHLQPVAYRKFMAQFPSQSEQRQMRKEQTISSFHNHLISHRTKQNKVWQWKGKLAPGVRKRAGAQPGQQHLQPAGCSASGHSWDRGKRHEARQLQHSKND